MFEDTVLIDGKGEIWFQSGRNDGTWVGSRPAGEYLSVLKDIPQPYRYAVLAPLPEFNHLCRSTALLGELEAAGVGDWDGYEDAIDSYNSWLEHNPQYLKDVDED